MDLSKRTVRTEKVKIFSDSLGTAVSGHISSKKRTRMKRSRPLFEVGVNNSVVLEKAANNHLNFRDSQSEPGRGYVIK